MALKLKNRATSTLAASITNTQTTISVAASTGSRFPSLGAGDWFPLVVVKPDTSYEIMRVTARSGDSLTVTRGQEGTAALAFDAGSRCDLRLTEAAVSDIIDSLEAYIDSGLATKANNPVTAGQIASDAVTTAKIANDAVTTAKIANDAVTTAKIANDGITTAKVANANITFAKIQNIASARFLGRYSAGSGSVQEGSFSSDFALDTGSGVLSLVSPSAMALLKTTTLASAAAQIEFGTPGNGTIDATYRQYEFEFHNIAAASGTPAFVMEVSTDGGATWKTTSGDYAIARIDHTASGPTFTNATTAVVIYSLTNTAAQGAGGKVTLLNPSASDAHKHVTWWVAREGFGGHGVGQCKQTAAINAVRFRAVGVNIVTGGSISMYGIK